jgi:1,4-dihydroxy-2-naphthoate octaprenyltransferase
MSESSDPDDSGADARAPDVGTVEAESDAPVVESRRERLLAYLRHNWSRIVVDAAVLAAWLLVTTLVFQWFALPWWLLYVVVFVGVVVYTRVTPSWRRPYKRQEP